jgi:hypothetical protein
MNGPGADAKRLGRLEDARAGRQLRLDVLNDIGAHRTTPESLPLCFGTREAQVDAAANDQPLELGECASYLVEQAPCRRRGVDVLLIQVEIDPTAYNRPSAPLIVGNTGDSGFVATAVGMGTHLGLSHPLPPGDSRNGTKRFPSLRMPGIVPSNRRSEVRRPPVPPHLLDAKARSVSATPLHGPIHVATVSRNGRGETHPGRRTR